MSDLVRELDALVPAFDESEADWQDAVRRGGRRPNRPVTMLAAALVAAVVATSIGAAIRADALDRLSTWVSGAPGEPAPDEEVEALRRENSRSLAPIPAEAELGLLQRQTISGVRFELLGFRDRQSLCLRLRSSSAESAIVKAPASCVSEELLVALGKPLAVVAAADPFPQRAERGVLALYGFAADDVASVELTGEKGRRKVAVRNNAFLSLYAGEGPRLSGRGRLDYQADIPVRATAFDRTGRALGSVTIMSLRRGYPGAPAPERLPGPRVVERTIESPQVGWLDRRELRGEPYTWGPDFAHLRVLWPNQATSMRVVVGLETIGPAQERVYCLTNVWPLQRRPRGIMCDPVGRAAGTLATASTMFDAQFPVHYGLVPDGVASLELVLANGETRKVPLLHNAFAVQTWSAEPAKLVGYDKEDRVALIRVISY